MTTSWTDYPATSDTPIKAIHVNEVRAAIDNAGGTPPGGWTDGPTVSSSTPVKAKHLVEIHDAIQTLWNNRNLGALPNWSSGVQPGGTSMATAATVIHAGDINDVRAWFNGYETWNNRIGAYATFSSSADVVNAVNQGWPGIGDVAGLGTPSSPYTVSQGEDQYVHDAYTQLGNRFWWLSFWTVSWPASGDTYYNAGYQGGRVAAQTIDTTNPTYLPTYVVLDPEGYNTKASTASQWADFINGFVQGVQSIDTRLPTAVYVGQSDYQNYNIGSLNVPVLLAVDFTDPGSPISGPNVQGYVAYYATCPADSYMNRAAGWGGRINTIQFSGSGVPCGP